MGGELKSTLDLVMERFGGTAETPALTEDQRREMGDIRKSFEAKVAEARILLKGDENLPRELSRLEREMEEKIERVRARKG
jgi:hypothetical protein